MAENDPRTVQLEDVILVFEDLETKKAAIAGGKEKHGATFLFDPTSESGKRNLAKCGPAIAAAEVQEFGAGKEGFIAKVVADPKRRALKKGEQCLSQEGEVYEGFTGMVAVSTSGPNGGKNRPALFNKSRQPVEVEDISEVFYRGVRCDAFVSFYCISDADKGGNGLFASVEGIRSRQVGDRLGGGGIRVTSTMFEALPDEDDGMGAATTGAASSGVGGMGGLLG